MKERIVRKAAAVFVISGVLKKRFSQYSKKIVVAHDAVDLRDFSTNISRSTARKQLGVDPNATVLVYAGSVQKNKGVDIVFSAARQFPDVVFYLAGRIADDMEEIVRHKPHNVICSGGYEINDIAVILGMADVLLLLNPVGPQSQSPMKMFEYMASKKPIISSRLPNLQEVLPKTNYFYEPEDELDFCDKIHQCLSQKSKWADIGEENYTIVSKYTYTERGSLIAEHIKKYTV
jgi:glycosyltransferase involved in cell wall biosynthesis